MRAIINNVIFWIGMLSFFNLAVTFPIIFNCFVIPRIEKKVGKKLEFTTSLYYWGCNTWLHYWDIAWYVGEKYIAMKITKKPSDQIRYKPSAALQKINYKVETASKFEIFISLTTITSLLLFFVIGALLYFKIIV